MKHLYALGLLLLPLSVARAQSVGIGTATPSPSAALEVRSTTKGLMLPRVSTAEMNAIGEAEPGLLVYNTTASKFYGSIPANTPLPAITQNSFNTTYDVIGALGQSFTPTNSGWATAFTIYAGSNISSAYTLRVYEGAGFGGTLLGTAVPQAPNAVGLALTYTLAGIPLTAGQTYTFSLTSNPSATSLQCTSNNPYAGGQVYYGASTPLAGYDLRFVVTSSSIAQWVPLH